MNENDETKELHPCFFHSECGGYVSDEDFNRYPEPLCEKCLDEIEGYKKETAFGKDWYE